MSDMIKWKQPKAAAEWEWEHSGEEAWRAAKGALLFWAIAGAVIMAVIYAVWPKVLVETAVAVLLAALGNAVQPFAHRLVYRWWRPTYVIDDKGIWDSRPQVRQVLWKGITSYRLSEHPDLFGHKVLEMRRSGSGRPNLRFIFDPKEVNEADLQAMLERHLPGRHDDMLAADTAFLDSLRHL